MPRHNHYNIYIYLLGFRIENSSEFSEEGSLCVCVYVCGCMSLYLSSPSGLAELLLVLWNVLLGVLDFLQ